MNHIGRIIEEHRHLKNITRKELSDGICTENYIYLIEKGKRTPSSDILRIISNKLNVNLYNYYPYIECLDPIKVHDTIQNIIECQRNADFVSLKKILNAAGKLPDFKHKPWFYILEVNKLSCQLFNEYNHEKILTEANKLLLKIDSKHSSHILMVNLYVLLSICYHTLDDINSSKDAAVKAYEISSSMHSCGYQDHVVVSSGINLMAAHYNSDEFDKAILIGEELAFFQQKANSFGRIHYTYTYLALSYYKSKLYDKAFFYFNKAIIIWILVNDFVGIHYIAGKETFDKMAKDERTNQAMVNEFYKSYNIHV